MGKDLFDKDLMNMDIRKREIESRLDKRTFDYHNNLKKLLADKCNDNTERMKLFDELKEDFSYIISMNRHVVDLSFDMAKKQLTEAFKKSGLVISDEE